VGGLGVSTWAAADLFENHISADIPLAWRRYYFATGDITWLASSWPALKQTCVYWECRFTRTDSVGAVGPGKCSPKDGKGNFTILNVICPDESSNIVNHSVYTNAAAAQTLQWCVDAATILNKTEEVPKMWSIMADSPYMPLNMTEYSEGPVHQNYAGYQGGMTNQADVALLQYPLGLKFPEDVARRDLDFWSTKTNFAGIFTGDAAYSVAYLGLGNRAKADEQLDIAWTHLETVPSSIQWMHTGEGRQQEVKKGGEKMK